MRHSWLAGFVALFLGSAAYAEADLTGAPPAFGHRNESVVPIDIDTVHVDYDFDYAARQANARAVMRFEVGAAGLPMFDLVPSVTAVKLDGQPLLTSDILTVNDPTQVTTVRVLNRVVDPGAVHELELSYGLSSNDVTFSSGAVRVGFFMSDLDNRQFFEMYGPANFEYDQVKFSMSVKVSGTSTEHEVFANGELAQTGDNSWDIDFPGYFTSSSLFFHLTDKGHYDVQRFTYDGLEASYPVVVYSSSASLTSRGVTEAKAVLRELESTYGPTAHERFVIYLTPDGGGMEHCGATMTSLWALGHELTHSWFARGVMPASGNAGWIDEAIASWRDNDYPRGREPSGSTTNLGGFSAYRRHTTQDAYTIGARLISNFDYLFADNGGMKSVLKAFFGERKRTTISNEIFKSFLERTTGRDLTAIFNRYVYGRSLSGDFLRVAPETFAPVDTSKHPRPYTKAELALYR